MECQPISPTLTTGERQALARCEATIERSLKGFLEVGMALKEISDNKLYRETHKGFRAYCSEKWGIKKSQAYHLISATEKLEEMEKVSTRVDTLPRSECQVRELSGLGDPEQMLEAWREAQEESGSGQPSRTEVARAVERVASRYAEPEHYCQKDASVASLGTGTEPERRSIAIERSTFHAAKRLSAHFDRTETLEFLGHYLEYFDEEMLRNAIALAEARISERRSRQR